MDQSAESSNKQRAWKKWTAAFAGIVAIWLLIPLIIRGAMWLYGAAGLIEAGQFGDQFGAINALVSGLTIWLVYLAYRGESGERHEAANRWKLERAETERRLRVDERDRHVALFFESLSRYVDARQRASVLNIHYDRQSGEVSKQRLRGDEVVVHFRRAIHHQLNEPSNSYLVEDDRQAFVDRLHDAYLGGAKAHLGPMFAHIPTMAWALELVEQADASASSMLKAAARDTITKHEFDLLASLAVADNDLRKFVCSVYVLKGRAVPFAVHQFDWLA